MDNNQQFVVPGGHGKAFHVKKDQVVTITDLEGQQVIDFIAFNSEDYKEYLSVTHTRTGSDGYNGRLFIREGDILLTNMRNPIAKIVEDTVGVHDLLIAACNPAYYKELGYPDHRSCHQNFADVLAPYGIGPWQRPDPFNIFQNTQIKEDGTYFHGDSPSKANDYIKIHFLMDSLCAVSVCPFDLYGFNGGKSTPVEINLE